MKHQFAFILLSQIALMGLALADPKPEAKTVPAPSVIAQNTADFVAKLPAKVFLLLSTKEANEATAKGLESLGAAPNTEFFVLPQEAVRPMPTRQGPPDYPKGMGSGSARIMGLISSSGEVAAVYCIAATHPAFAVNAAKAVASWKFKPAKLKDAAVPVLFTQLIEFNIYMSH